MDQPKALIVDDDLEFNKMMRVILLNLGIEAECTNDPKEFLARLKTSKPDLCLVDLNIGQLGVGYTIIKAVRTVLGPHLPLFVVSGLSDRQSIAHALEIGATDFVVKPVAREVLAAKLGRYIQSEQLAKAQISYEAVPAGQSPSFVECSLEIQEVDEVGMKVFSPLLLSKGSHFYLIDPLVKEMTGKDAAVLVNVASTWVEVDGKYCGASLEFDAEDESLRASVRRWLSLNVTRGA